MSRGELVALLYIVAFSLFIYGLSGLTGPSTAVRGNRIAESDGWLSNVMLVRAIACGTINVIGGFLVTDRMLEMFKPRKPKSEEAPK